MNTLPATTPLDRIEALVGQVPDPEVPVLTIADLGVLRSVERIDGRIVVTITPTYSGCPAMHHIEGAIVDVIAECGEVGEVRTVFGPAWTTDWITAEGRAKLRDYGIAPPRAVEVPTTENLVHIRGHAPRPVECPRCDSAHTEMISEFGSTSCKSLWRCLDCLEPFDHFKEL